MKSLLCFCLLPLCGFAITLSAEQISVVASQALGTDPSIRDWLIIGPFENHQLEGVEEGSISRSGYAEDFLGGESGFAPDASALSSQRFVAAKNGLVDFEKVFGKQDMKVAYAYTVVFADKEQEVLLGFGSDDSAKIWLNGESVHEFWTPGRGTREDEDELVVTLLEGPNTILVKVEEAVGGWGFILNLYGEEARAARQEAKLRKRFGRGAVTPVRDYDYTFSPGNFPEIDWRHPGMMQQLNGEMPLTVRWFNSNLEEVTTAEEPGRYMAYIEAELPSGQTVRRGLTFTCMPALWRPWMAEGGGEISLPSNSPFSAEALEQRSDEVGEWYYQAATEHMSTSHSGAILAAYLSEMQPSDDTLTPLDNPLIAHNEAQLALKRKMLGVEDKAKPLHPPGKTNTPGLVLRPGNLSSAGFKPGLGDAVREICEAWATVDDGSNGPFTLMIARDGEIVFHEAFQSPGWDPVSLETKYYVASISKAVSGLLFAEFLSQGILSLNDPVGEYLPDFPVTGPKAITLRQCFTHTTGFEGHWSLGQGGPWNPYLDNIAAQILDEELEPGVEFKYNGIGFILAGRVMEIAAGKNIQRLFQEDLFNPLGIENASMLSLGTSGMFSAEDIAKFGQLLSNKGTYGDLLFFTETVYEEILPKRLGDFYPEVGDKEYGIGLDWMKGPTIPKSDQTGGAYYNELMLGHGSATASILQVGTESGIVIAAGRKNRGQEADRYVNRIIRAIHDHTIERDRD